MSAADAAPGRPAAPSLVALARVIGTHRAPDGSLAARNFAHWFAGSRVVHDDGLPRVVYHGTAARFSAFDPHASAVGCHFSCSPRVGSSFTRRTDYRVYPGGHVLPVYLRIVHPLRVKDLGQWRPHELIDECHLRGGLRLGHARALHRSVEAGRYTDLALHAALAQAGHDGIVYDNECEGGGDSWIVFRPEQVKSAIGNCGAFDPLEPDFTDEPARACRRLAA